MPPPAPDQPAADPTAPTAVDRATILAVSLKMYLSYTDTLRWSTQVAAIARRHPATLSGAAELAVLPSFPAIPAVKDILAGTGVHVGAQNASWQDSGPYTGEVSPAMLAEIGCRYAEIGHAERRGVFGESDAVVANKTAAALRNGLTVLLCVGEPTRTTPQDAAHLCVQQIASALEPAAAEDLAIQLVVGYEPQWAIGAAEPAPAAYIAQVCQDIQGFLQDEPMTDGSKLIYGGSAGPGLLTRLGGTVDGLFLGRFAHDPAALELMLDEVRVPAGATR